MLQVQQITISRLCYVSKQYYFWIMKRYFIYIDSQYIIKLTSASIEDF